MAAGKAQSELRAETRTRLLALFDAAVAAAHPDVCLPAHLPLPPEQGRLYVVGAGKAAAAMAVAAEAHYRQARRAGPRQPASPPPRTARPRPSTGCPPDHARDRLGAPPDAGRGERRARRSGRSAWLRRRRRTIWSSCLLSGGASALWAAPAAGLTLAAKTGLTRGLLKCGADIHEMNTVRRHISRIKGGRLRKATAAPMLTLAISDVPGDDPATIGSGPTVPDPTTLADARAVLDRRRPAMEALGLSGAAGRRRGARRSGQRDAEARRSRPSAAPSIASSPRPPRRWPQPPRWRKRQGYEVIDLGDAVTGEAREVAKAHAKLAREAKAAGRRAAIISGGELAVTVRNASGRGGRNQEYALALALALEGRQGISALAADTDGIDGGEGQVTDPAGAIIDAATLSGARHLDAQKFLDNNDATSFFEAAGGLIVRGPTHTNVNDFRVILVDA